MEDEFNYKGYEKLFTPLDPAPLENTFLTEQAGDERSFSSKLNKNSTSQRKDLTGFTYLAPPELPEGLFDKIINRIREEKHLFLMRRRMAFVSGGLIIGSAAAFVPISRMVWAGLVESGFTQFFSLIFSDAGAVAGHWQNFAFALMESLPVVSVIMLLTVIFTFLQSLKVFSQGIKVIFAPVNIN